MIYGFLISKPLHYFTYEGETMVPSWNIHLSPSGLEFFKINLIPLYSLFIEYH